MKVRTCYFHSIYVTPIPFFLLIIRLHDAQLLNFQDVLALLNYFSLDKEPELIKEHESLATLENKEIDMPT